MNCKPGDLARIVKPGEWLGYMVNVIELAPRAVFTLPDGQKHRMPTEPDSWVCEAMGEGFPVWLKDGLGNINTRHAKYVCIADRHLRPIRDPGEDAQDESLQWLPSPAKEPASV